MNPNTAIQIRNLSKQYRLGQVGTGTLSHDLKRWWTTNVLGKEDPYLKIGEVNDRAHKGQSDYVWALKDINLEIARGDVVGIIGKNGAGKSTLLKLLSRVTKPSTGTIQYRGRIASLLEVGTGFHPEMTGRENIYMNGAIMGMTRHEITRKLDEIIAFAGVERYIDTPVKRYSSGMTVRLGFAVAAHLEPDILVVDEVLAVGDAEFQKKAIGKMQDVSRQGGRTVLFVSHNMAAVKSLCYKGIVVKDGSIVFEGKISKAIDYYLNSNANQGIKNNKWDRNNCPGTDKIKVKKAYVNFNSEILTVNTSFEIITEFWCEEEGFSLNISTVVKDVYQNCVFNLITKPKVLKKGLHKVVFHIPDKFMNNGSYMVDNYFVAANRPHFIHKDAHSFEIVDERNDIDWFKEWIGAVRPNFIRNEMVFLNED